MAQDPSVVHLHIRRTLCMQREAAAADEEGQLLLLSLQRVQVGTGPGPKWGPVAPAPLPLKLALRARPGSQCSLLSLLKRRSACAAAQAEATPAHWAAASVPHAASRRAASLLRAPPRAARCRSPAAGQGLQQLPLHVCHQPQRLAQLGRPRRCSPRAPRSRPRRARSCALLLQRAEAQLQGADLLLQRHCLGPVLPQRQQGAVLRAQLGRQLQQPPVRVLPRLCAGGGLGKGIAAAAPPLPPAAQPSRRLLMPAMRCLAQGGVSQGWLPGNTGRRWPGRAPLRASAQALLRNKEAS
jgi:hypothetical protein